MAKRGSSSILLSRPTGKLARSLSHFAESSHEARGHFTSSVGTHGYVSKRSWTILCSDQTEQESFHETAKWAAENLREVICWSPFEAHLVQRHQLVWASLSKGLLFLPRVSL